MHMLATRKLEKLVDYCAAVARVSDLFFVLLLSTLSLGMSAAVDYGMTELGFRQVERPELLRQGVIGFLLIAVIFGPILETLLLQQLPILIARRFGAPLIAQFAMGAIPFAAAHFESGAITGIAAGIVGGTIFSLAYLTLLPQSKMKAFWMTAGIHSLHNVVPGILYIRDLP